MSHYFIFEVRKMLSEVQGMVYCFIVWWLQLVLLSLPIELLHYVKTIHHICQNNTSDNASQKYL